MKTHTRADGSFVDAKAEKVAEVYKKACEEKLTEIDDDGPKTSMNSSELSTHRDLNIDDKNEIFLQYFVVMYSKRSKGQSFWLGSLLRTHGNGKRKECYARSFSSIVVELQEQLRRKIAEHDTENTRRDEEHNNRICGSQDWQCLFCT
ncbi:putative transposase, Ptta/En/Spm, plant [Arabidopsis thaliana]